MCSSFPHQVSYKANDNCYDNWWLTEFHTQAHHSATRIFSPSKSYVHLELVLGTLSCGQTQEIRTQYILNRDLLKDEKELTFYYLVRMRIPVSLSNCINSRFTRFLSEQQVLQDMGVNIGVFGGFVLKDKLLPMKLLRLQFIIFSVHH